MLYVQKKIKISDNEHTSTKEKIDQDLLVYWAVLRYVLDKKLLKHKKKNVQAKGTIWHSQQVNLETY